jgi:hypothetical protein
MIDKIRKSGRFVEVTAPTRHLGANKGYASKHIYFTIKNHTLLNTTKCRVGAGINIISTNPTFGG